MKSYMPKIKSHLKVYSISGDINLITCMSRYEPHNAKYLEMNMFYEVCANKRFAP